MSFDLARLATEKAAFRPVLPVSSLPGVNGTHMTRKAISKKVRFEVFKRDGFKCQYCGCEAPKVVLNVDHINPVAKGGKNDILNLITSCEDCNSGKSDRLLSDDSAVEKQRRQIEGLSARREQLEMMLQWRDGLKDIQAGEVDAIADAWKAAAAGWRLSDTGRKEAKTLLKKHGLQRVLDAIDTAADSYLKFEDGGMATKESVDLGWRKVAGICALSALPEDERRLYYVKAILNKRLDYVPYDVLADLKSALAGGVSVKDMELEAKHCTSWTRFSNWLHG